MPDIFDQIHAQTTGTAQASQGDIFDQIHSQRMASAPAYAPPASPAAYFQQHPTMDPLAVEQAYGQLQGRQNIPEPVTPQQFRGADAAGQGVMKNASDAALTAIAQPVQGMVGLVNPQAGQQVQQNIATAYGAPTGAGGFVGRQIGNAVNLPYTLTPAGRMLSAAGAMGNQRIEVANRRDSGEQIGGAEELARVAGTGALDYGTNVALNQFGGKLFGGAIAPAAQQTAGRLLLAYAKRFGQDAVTNEAIMHANLAASNLIANRPINEGMGVNSVADAMVQTAGQMAMHAGPNLLERMRGKQESAAGNQPAPQLPHDTQGNTGQQNQQPLPQGSHELSPRANEGQEGQPQENGPQGQSAQGGPRPFDQTVEGQQQPVKTVEDTQGQHAPDNRPQAAPTEQGKENVSSDQGQTAPVENGPRVPEARSAEGEKLPVETQSQPAAGTEPVSPGPEGTKNLPELPAGHEGWSYKQLKDWAGENGFETEGAKGKLTLRNKLFNQLLSQEKSLRRTEPLTGAPNTIKYHEDAQNIFKDADTKNEHTALVETDIGGLKVMNTVYGHEGGDEMLKLAHQAMREELRVPPQRNGRSQDYLGSSAYRTGGDEFPLILRNVDSPEKAKVVMDRVNANFDKKLAEKFPDLPAEARPFIAHNAEIRKPGDTRSITEMRAIADKGVEPVKSAIKAQRNIPEGRTDLLNYIKERQQKASGEESNVLSGGRRAGAVAVPESVNKLFERDVRPAVEETKGNLSKSWDALNRFAGTGENLRGKVRDTANDIRTMLGQQEVHTARLETAIKPYRDVMKTMTPDERAAWVDQVESTGATAAKNAQGVNMPGQSTDPRLQGLADLSHEQNVKNIEDAQKYGIKEANKWDANWVGRDFGDEGAGNRTSVGGSQAFRIKRQFDTYSDAKAAVEAAGHKMRFDNEADMLLYKQAQVRKNIDARRMMYEAEDRGQLKWVPEDEKKPETHDTELQDRLARQERDVVSPKWVVAKLAKLEHFDAQKYMESDEWKKNTQVLRPGDSMPDGTIKTGQTVKGTFAGDSNTAGLFNNLISAGVNSHAPVLKQIAQVRRAVTASNLAIPAAHASLETIGNAVTQGSNALDNLFHGELGLAAKNAYRAINPFAANKLGRQVREQAADPTAHPHLEDIVQTVQRGGNKFDLKSVLNQDSLKDAQKEWQEGNKIGAVPRLLKGIYTKAVSPLFDHFIPNIKAAYKAAAAETAIQRGLSGKELDQHMARVQDNADNILGMVKRDFQFQHKILTDVEDIAFNAPKFAEGTVRFAGAAVRDTAQALKAAVTGKEPKVTPAMYTALSGLIMHSIGAAMFQMAYSTATTGKPQMPDKLEDYIRPRTGRVDDKGREQRVSVLSPFSFLFSAGKDLGKSLTSRTATLWRSAKNVADNADERNVQIANPNDSFLKRMKDRAAYMGKEAMPFAAQNLMQNKQEGHKTTADQVVGEGLGFHFSYGASTPAEKAAMDTVYSHARQAPRTREEADKADLIRGLSERVRSKDPSAMGEVRAAVKEGKLGPSDVQTIHKRAVEAPGLKGILGQGDLGARDVMENVWPKMSAQERKENQWMIRGKVGRAENLTPQQRLGYFKQINSDMKAGAA